MKKFLGLIGLGAALTYFFHPEQGARRRAVLRARFPHKVEGAEALRTEFKQLPDDVTLARQVESELFEDEAVPKGQINVNAENGKIVLRGEVGEQEMIVDLEQRARSVQGVSDVENLLHLPGVEAPMHE